MNTAPRKNRGSLPKLTAPRIALVLSSIMAAAAQAQTQPAAPAANDEVVKLNPFVVSTEKDVGYRASNSIAGTRSNTAIRDISTNIQVITPELIDDVLVNSHVDLERYNASLYNGGGDKQSDNAIQQQYNGFLFRGFVQNWSLRDGVRVYDPIDAQGINRIEVVKGPAGALYGITYPGGVMNTISKDVIWGRNFGRITATAFDQGGYRATLDANTAGKLGHGDIAIRFNGAYAETEDHRAHSEGTQNFSQINFGWRPLRDTELKLTVEKSYREKPLGLGYFTDVERDSNGNPIGANNAVVPLQITRPNIPWDWNWATGSTRSAETSFVKGSITQQISDNFQVNAYWQVLDRQNIDANGWDGNNYSNEGASWDVPSSGGRTGWINPNTSSELIRLVYHYRDWNNINHAYGVTGVYKLDLGEVKNTITFGGHAWGERFHSHSGNQPATTTTFFNMPVRAGVNTRSNQPIPADFNIQLANKESNSNDYYFISWQAAMLENRLKLNASVNKTSIYNINYGNDTGSRTVTDVSKTNPSFGVVYDITKDVSAFYSHSTSLFPTSDKNDFDETLPPVKGTGDEIGLKFDLIENKLSGTVSYYQIIQDGGSQRDPSAINRAKRDWDGLSATERAARWPGLTRDQLLDRSGNAGDLVAGAESESKGFEIDLVYQPIKSYQVLLSYAHNTAKVKSAVNQSIVGHILNQGAAKDQLALMNKYSFLEGDLKGLSLGLGVTYASKTFQNYDGPGGTARFHPSTLWAELFANYKFKAFGYENFIQFNAKNLTAQEEYFGWRATGSASRISVDPYEIPTKRTFGLTYGINF